MKDCRQFKSMTPTKRVEIVREKKLCFNCLDHSNHSYRKCRKNDGCSVQDCSKKHSSLLHDALSTPDRKQDAVKKSEEVKKKDEVKTGCVCGPAAFSKTTRIALPIVTVYVRGKDQEKFTKTQALLDTGSNKTFCSESLANDLQLKGQKTKLFLETLGEDQQSSVIELQLEASSNPSGKGRLTQLPRVYALKTFPKLTQKLAKTDIEEWRHLRDLKITNSTKDNIGLLIGQDVPAALRPLEIRRGGDDEPDATRSVFGWCLNGPISSQAEEVASSNFVRTGCDSADALLQAQVEQFWKIDGGTPILAKSRPHPSREDQRALQIWDQSCCQQDGHYNLDIPFRDDQPRLPNNRRMAERRLHSLGIKLSKDPQLHEKYKAGIQDLLNKGFAEMAPEEAAQDGVEWYLPHHNVVNPSKPEKFRIVFDCSAEYAGTSLNKEVLQGPDLTNWSVSSYDSGKDLSLGDVEAMFHQLRVTEKQRNA
ncbi:uncharacterized protein LOC135499958 [Lineus longissimus]|uniref:uncharacterized protein LOC135499958 n=1 Tax=Lineus longissimus TaxID=88925 RepID=UPI00315DA550